MAHDRIKGQSGAALGGWVLPSDWEAEWPEWLPGCVIVGNERIGRATVDMARRRFELGYCKPHPHPGALGGCGFAGSNWRREIMDAAERCLRACASGVIY